MLALTASGVSTESSSLQSGLAPIKSANASCGKRSKCLQLSLHIKSKGVYGAAIVIDVASKVVMAIYWLAGRQASRAKIKTQGTERALGPVLDCLVRGARPLRHYLIAPLHILSDTMQQSARCGEIVQAAAASCDQLIATGLILALRPTGQPWFMNAPQRHGLYNRTRRTL